MAKKPDVASLIGVTGRASKVATRETILRFSGQPDMLPPLT
jgi:hypothetical protein